MTPLLTSARILVEQLDAPFWYEAVRDHGVTERIEPLDSLLSDELDTGSSETGLIGAIYPMSRCGSTLVVRQIAAVPRLFALSEPLTTQHLLDGPAADEALTVRRIRTLIGLYRTALAPVAERIVIKWPLTMVHHAEVLARALPEVPTLFLHRDPHRVMASIARAPLSEPRVRATAMARMAASIARGGGDPAGWIDDPLERIAHLVAGACLAAADAGDMARLDYQSLPVATADAILPAFGFTPSKADRAAMATAAQFHSKDSKRRRAFAERPISDDARVARLARDIVAPALARTIERLPLLAGAGTDQAVGH